MEWWQFLLVLMITINTCINVMVFFKVRKIIPRKKTEKDIEYLSGKGKLCTCEDSDANLLL